MEEGILRCGCKTQKRIPHRRSEVKQRNGAVFIYLFIALHQFNFIMVWGRMFKTVSHYMHRCVCVCASFVLFFISLILYFLPLHFDSIFCMHCTTFGKDLSIFCCNTHPIHSVQMVMDCFPY